MPHPKVFLVSLGCPKNRVDSEVMLGELVDKGYEIATEADDADLLLVNTCSFIHDAREESVDTILDLGRVKAEAGGHKKLVVAGCLSQRYAQELQAELPEVDAFLGTGNLAQSIDRVAALARAGAGGQPDVLTAPVATAGGEILVGRPGFNYDAHSPRVQTTAPWTAYVKIAEGCSQRCAFCIIPQLRGGQKSRPIADVVQEVRHLVGGGVREVNLIAQDLTHYGTDFKPLGDGGALTKLLRQLAQVDDLRWVRLLYNYPHNFTDELIDVLATQDKILPYVDMPLQHITDNVLTRMRRRFSERDTRALVDKLRERIPGLVFRTTFLVGHPGETDEDFEALMDFVESSRFERVGVFAYSREEGTRAARMDDQVPPEVAAARRDALMAAQQPLSAAQQAALVGTEIEVLVEGASDETDLLLQGRTYGQAPDIDGVTYINEGWAEPGTFARAEVVDAGDYDLVARLLAPGEQPASHQQ